VSGRWNLKDAVFNGLGKRSEKGNAGQKSRRGAGCCAGYVWQTALLLLIAQDQQGTTQQDHDGGDGNVDKDE
jgi:hypothetical protein